MHFSATKVHTELFAWVGLNLTFLSISGPAQALPAAWIAGCGHDALEHLNSHSPEVSRKAVGDASVRTSLLTKRRSLEGLLLPSCTATLTTNLIVVPFRLCISIPCRFLEI